MAFMDKLGQMAGKIGEVAGDTFDYGKAKGKIVLEKGKAKDANEKIAVTFESSEDGDGGTFYVDKKSYNITK